jgi:hypothetical protein
VAADWARGGAGRGRPSPRVARPCAPSPPSSQLVEDKTFGLKNKKKSAKVQK